MQVFVSLFAFTAGYVIIAMWLVCQETVMNGSKLVTVLPLYLSLTPRIIQLFSVQHIVAVWTRAVLSECCTLKANSLFALKLICETNFEFVHLSLFLRCFNCMLIGWRTISASSQKRDRFNGWSFINIC